MEQNWLGLLIVFVVILVIIGISILTSIITESKLVKSGVLPPVNKTTDEDIRRLVKSGYKIWAIKRFRQIHNVSLKEAKEHIKSF